jgi:mxaC protein
MVLWLLPLALLPWVLSAWRRVPFGSVAPIPADGLSLFLDIGLRCLGTLGLAGLILGLAMPYVGGETVSRTGSGAQIVMLLDRSGSMNDTFAGRTPQGGEESKASATKRILRDFIGRRPHDLIGVAAFSTAPMLAMPLTDRHDAVRAAIDASDRPGLDFTNMARGLGMALSMFSTDRPEEHHVILLVSDGGAVIETHLQDQLRAEFRKFKTDLYFLFLRTQGSKGMFDKPAPGEDTPQVMPERYLDLFFESLNIPYRAFQAENPDQIQAAIRQIDGLARFPITYTERMPRRDLDGLCYDIVFAAIILLLGAKLSEVSTRSRAIVGVGRSLKGRAA